MLYYIPPDVLISFVLVSASNALSIVFPVVVVVGYCVYYAKDSSDGDGYAICDGLLLFTDHDHLQNQWLHILHWCRHSEFRFCPPSFSTDCNGGHKHLWIDNWTDIIVLNSKKNLYQGRIQGSAREILLINIHYSLKSLDFIA